MKTIKIFAILISIFTLSTAASAQVTGTATATGTIVTPIAIQKTVDMNFGNVAVGSTAGTVVLNPAGSRTLTGGVTLPANTGTVTAAEFKVTGVVGYGFTITLPSTSHQVKSGTNTMTIANFVSTPGATSSIAEGGTTIKVGATLNVAANQAAGVYTSVNPFEVTVNYN